MGNFPAIDRLRKEGISILTEFESKRLLRQSGIPVVETRLARTQKEAVLLSQKVGFPVALKIASPDILHKSDSGGVKLALNHVSEVRAAFREVMDDIKNQYPCAVIEGVSIQKMAKPGIEVIVGASKDPQFGPVIMFGLGGVFVEVLKDVSFRIIPIGRKDAQEMIEEIKGYPLLQGYRGKRPADIPALIEILLKISRLMEENPEIKELDLNPVIAHEKGALAVDARIILESEGAL
ncbi:MAG: acetate--CoA ligase family protein [Thermodesulfobacteriota bacterium]|nr:acetate--CoA ligase family protein [Thermodesulfobacteriota bacterium]